MEDKHIIDLLEEHGIKPTANRIVIASALAAGKTPLSLKELEYSILSIDKSNISRTLALFRKHRLVHDIEDGGGCVKYELCMSHAEDDDEDMHVHFYCESCHKTFCLWDTPIPEVSVPAGFVRKSVNYVLKGLCDDCARKKALRRQ
ncbi:Fur family transcriptional regulator [Prevotella sp. KH2C16]|uniref:Fur family transcriptional regulator n=1 Tax=Prevotella sp. KH2C16 TaxID=1855325 RepID=UPI0008E154E2|nr:transcriptional repressor [Prevotella sp. KH2C16]SFG29669.1 Fur family transcriptional regulator, ferric uptake regulator [Prevotella sp. KH2C16]